jgi:hypothetical protein
MPNKETLNALADKWTDAAYGNVEITPEDLAVLGIEPQDKFESKEYGLINVNEGWESFCTFVYEKLTGNAHPGSAARGRGFRSQAYGKAVADAIRGLPASE